MNSGVLLSGYGAMNKRKVVFLFPPSAARLSSIDEVMNCKDGCPERYLFYGLDSFKKKGIPFVHNVRHFSYNRPQRIIRWLHHLVFGKLFLFYGEIEWVFPVWWNLYKSPLWFVFSERIMLAIIYWQLFWLLPRRPAILIPMGLPEKLKVLKKDRPWLYIIVVNSLKKIDCIICVSKLEEKILNNDFGINKNTKFLPAGVDSHYFQPMVLDEDVDVLSIGADIHRDFALLLSSARTHTDLTFRIITTHNIAESLEDVPTNMNIITDVNMRAIREHIGRAKIVALPVIPNSYSGATTVLLQAMAMGKAVIANKEGANADGYPFRNGENVFFVSSCIQQEMDQAIESLTQDNNLRLKIGKNARDTICNESNIVAFHNKIIDVISSVLQQQKQK